MNEDRLLALIDYWIEHNREHEQEFRDWAEKTASSSGEAAQQLLEAAARMAEASNCLEKSRQALTRGGKEK